jgi:hypothetical protein
MSGFYNNWFKVNNPNTSNDIPPMESGGYQIPFYFGGSQVPINLNIPMNEINGSGNRKVNFMPTGKGIHHKHSNIHIPKHIGSLKTTA